MGNLVEYEESDTEEALKKNAGQPIKLSGDQDNGKKISEELEECASTIIWQDFSHNACEGSSSNASWSSIKRWFVDMGCSSTIVDKAIDIYGTKNEDDILEYVLACQAADYSSDSSHQDSFTDLERLEWEDTYNFGENEVKSQPQFSEFAHLKEAQPEDFKADIIMAQLMEMGYSENEISAAIQINGVHTHIHELVDFIHAYMQETEIGKNVVNVVLENYKDKGKKKQNGENRLTLSSWWKKTQQTGTLIEKEDVQDLTREVLEEVIDRVGGFDLIVGGSPCNNLSGNNRVSRNGLEGKQSSIFYEFPRILNEIRQIMHSKPLF
ncbi:hypothetical protein SUGI_0745750 [Cryptomeria japonica]|nr:hypothetical protein SUGI_0745750 [Cryptomeria japonica]